MKIYFIASSRLVLADKKTYESMYSHLNNNFKMVSDKVNRWLKEGVIDVQKTSEKKRVDNYKTSIDSVKKADLIIMEVTGHSMSMGYLVSKALEMNKPVIALHKKNHAPVFIAGINDAKLLICEYDNHNVLEVIDKAIKKVEGLIDVRFNFFVNPNILTYLDWVSHRRMVPKSVFLRELIEKEIKKDKEFNK